jgi:hypothetical protein
VRHPSPVTSDGQRVELAAEGTWLLLSTALLAVLAFSEPTAWRYVWLALLVVNAALVGYRVRRMTRAVRQP